MEACDQQEVERDWLMRKRTDLNALDAIYPLEPTELYRQWVLSQDAAMLPEAWTRHSLCGWNLAAHENAHVCELRSETGEQLGWVIEPLVYLREEGSEIAADSLVLPTTSRRPEASNIERALYGRDVDGHSDGSGVQGMWIAVLPAVGRVYLGPIHSVVFDRTRRLVATSHNLLGSVQRDVELSRLFDPLATFQYYSFGLTAFHNVERLLPNHYLDLETFEPVRHWPKCALKPLALGEDGAAEIVEDGRRLLAGVHADVEQFEVPLSAGNDSRAVLALLRPLAQSGMRISPFTSVGVNFESRIDAQAAARLAAIAGLPHEIRRRPTHEAAPMQDVMRNFARIGEAKAGRSLSAPGALAKEPVDQSPGKFFLAGMAGETGRANYWSRGAPNDLGADALLRRIGAPVSEQTRSAALAWLDELPEHIRDSPADVLDLAYVEQRLGCWEANSRYLYPGRPRGLSPMASAFSIETMLRLPLDYRRSGKLQRDMVGYGWPELSKVPYNRATGVLRIEQLARRVSRKARRAIALR